MILDYISLLMFALMVFIMLHLCLNKFFFFNLIPSMILFIMITQFVKANSCLWTNMMMFIITLNNLYLKLENLILYGFILLSVMTMMLSYNLMMYLSVEIQTFSLLILIGSNSNNMKS